MPVTEQEARAIAFLAAKARPYGARRWDESGIFANVMKVADRSLGSVTIAAIQAAEDRNAETPGVISKPGPHWRDPESAPLSTRPLNRGPWCGICGVGQELHRAADHDYEPPADRKRAPEAIRAIVEEAKGRKEPTRVAVEEPAAPQHDPRADVAREALKEDA